MESLSNLGFVCAKHAPKPNPEYAEKPLEFFLGKHIKAGFEGTHPAGKSSIEHMWVRIDRIDGDQLSGILDNDPVLRMSIRYGDRVLVSRDAIESAIEDLTPGNKIPRQGLKS